MDNISSLVVEFINLSPSASINVQRSSHPLWSFTERKMRWSTSLMALPFTKDVRRPSSHCGFLGPATMMWKCTRLTWIDSSILSTLKSHRSMLRGWEAPKVLIICPSPLPLSTNVLHRLHILFSFFSSVIFSLFCLLYSSHLRWTDNADVLVWLLFTAVTYNLQLCMISVYSFPYRHNLLSCESYIIHGVSVLKCLICLRPFKRAIGGKIILRWPTGFQWLYENGAEDLWFKWSSSYQKSFLLCSPE